MAGRDHFWNVYEALRSARESRDGYPGEYSPELVALVRAICAAMGLDDATMRTALEVSLRHDIGKLGVAAEVLFSDGPLTEAQRKALAEYPVFSARIVAAIPGMEDVSTAIRHVQERWDGGGYPDGLAGEEIPIAGRIVAVAASYIAMSTPRPHRAAMHPRVACDELKRGAGTQFDPAVVKVVLDLIGPLLHTTG